MNSRLKSNTVTIIKEAILRNYRNYIIYAGFILIIILFSILLKDTGFLTFSNIMNILRQTAMVSVMAVGTTYTIIAGDIDLSIGATVSLSAMVCASLLSMNHSIFIAVFAALGVGIIVGLFNGIITTKVRLPAIIVTLGTQSILVGLSRSIGIHSIPITNRTFNFIFGSGNIGNISTLFIWTILIVAIGQIVLKKTPFGRKVHATGGNRLAARYSGVRIDRIRITTLTISAFTAAMAGLLYAGRLHGARYTLGEADLLTVIAAVVIGGTSLAGGRGTVIGSIVGSLLMGVLNNALLIMGLTVSEQMIARGIIIIIAISVSLRESREE